MDETLDASNAIDAIFAPRAVDISYRADGCLVLRSPIALGECRDHLCEYLRVWADAAPDRTFIAERDEHGAWRRLSYEDARRRALVDVRR